MQSWVESACHFWSRAVERNDVTLECLLTAAARTRAELDDNCKQTCLGYDQFFSQSHVHQANASSAPKIHTVGQGQRWQHTLPSFHCTVPAQAGTLHSVNIGLHKLWMQVQLPPVRAGEHRQRRTKYRIHTLTQKSLLSCHDKHIEAGVVQGEQSVLVLRSPRRSSGATRSTRV